jgi:hypothetical protein
MNLNDSVTHCIAAEKKGIYISCSRILFIFNKRMLSAYNMKAIFMLIVRYQISGSHTSGKNHSL